MMVMVSAVLGLDCSTPDLPGDQLLVSEHFRYHARAGTVVDPMIVDRLEAHRTQFTHTFAIGDELVDYYRFEDWQDFHTNSPCPGRDCTEGRSVFSVTPFHEHELVHALLADSGDPAPLVQEGIAQRVACIQPHAALPFDPRQWVAIASTWPTTADPVLSRGVYDFGLRLVTWMLETAPASHFLAFYRQSLPTVDPGLFAFQFESSYHRRLEAVATELVDKRFAGSTCPCSAPDAPVDGRSISFVAGEEYRTLELSDQSLVEVQNEASQVVFPTSCANSADEPRGAGPPAIPEAPTVTLVRAGAGRFVLTTLPEATGTVRIRTARGEKSDWSCAAAAAGPPMAIGEKDFALWVTPEFSARESWFAIALEGPRVMKGLTWGTDVTVCAACSSLGPLACTLLPPGGTEFDGTLVDVPPSGVLLVHVIVRQPHFGPGDSAGVLFRRPR
jgi:hypothetical protein